MRLSPHEHIFPRTLLQPQSHAIGSPAGTAVDVQGFEDALVVVNCGAIAGTVAIILQEGDASGGPFADIEDDDAADLAVINLSSAQDNSIVVGRIKVSNFKQFLIPATTVAGGAAEIGIMLLPLEPKYNTAMAQLETVAFNITGKERTPSLS